MEQIYIYIYIYIYMHDFQQFETIRSFGDNIYTGKISVNEAEMDQVNLLEKMKKWYNSIINLDKKQKKARIRKEFN